MKEILLETALKRHRKLSDLIEKTEHKLSQFPEGRLKIKTHGKSVYYFLIKDNDKFETLSKQDLPLVKLLAQKAYLKKILPAAKQELICLEKYIKGRPEHSVEQIYETVSPDRRDLIDPIWKPDADYAAEWLALPYERKGFMDGAPFFVTANQERVRSKSEVIIADRLRAKGIPYRYECSLRLKTGTIHPDFTILRLSDRKELYLEHLGKMDDPEYTEALVNRMNNYALAGIYQNDRLYLTFETARFPLDIGLLDKMIEDNFR